MGRGKGDDIRELIYRCDQLGPEYWKDVKFMIFDCPTYHQTVSDKFEERISTTKQKLDELLQRSQDRSLPNVQLVPFERCRGFDHLHSKLCQIVEMVI